MLIFNCSIVRCSELLFVSQQHNVRTVLPAAREGEPCHAGLHFRQCEPHDGICYESVQQFVQQSVQQPVKQSLQQPLEQYSQPPALGFQCQYNPSERAQSVARFLHPNAGTSAAYFQPLILTFEASTK